MMHAYPLFRLLWRRGLLYDLAVTALFLLVLATMGTRGGVKLFGNLSEFEAGYVTAQSLEFLTCLFTGVALGVVTNFAMQGLLYSRFSWGLPDLAKRLRSGLFLMAGLTTLLSGAIGWVLEIIDHGPGLWQGAALGLLGFGIGNQTWDPHLGKRVCWSTIAFLCCLALGAEYFAAWAEQFPMAFPFLALAVAGLSIFRSTTQHSVRTRTVVPEDQLGSSFDSAGRGETHAQVKKNARAGYPRWRHGRIQSPHSWLQAQCYEQYGWIRGLWKEMTRKLVLVTTGIVFALSLGVIFLGKTGDFSAVASIMVGALMLPMMFLFFTKTDLRRGTHYSLSRIQRADVIWRSCKLHGFTAMILTVLILLIPHLLGKLFLDSPSENRSMTVVLAIILSLSVWIPCGQWSRMRWIEPKQLSANSPRFILVFGLFSVAYMVLINGSIMLLLEVESAMTFAALWLCVPCLWFGSQYIFRSKLRKHLTTADLH